MNQTLYYVIFDDSYVAEGRKFFKGEKYPVTKHDDEYVSLHAENGYFNLSNELMEKMIIEWKLEKVEANG